MTDELEFLAQKYAGKDFRKRRVATVNLWPDMPSECSLEEFALGVMKAQMRCEELKGKNARFVFEYGGYDGSSGSVSILCDALEDEQEVVDRIERSLAYAHRELADERREYYRLKRKFGP